MALAVCRRPEMSGFNPRPVDAGFVEDRATNGLLYRPVSFHECSIHFCSFMYYRAVSIPCITNYQLFCYPTLHTWLLLFEGTDIILTIHTHTRTDPSSLLKTPSDQTG